MVDDAEFDRAAMHKPAAILALAETHRLADQRLAQIDLGTAPADGTIAMDAPHAGRGRVFGLAQNPIPMPRRARVISGRRGVAARQPARDRGDGAKPHIGFVRAGQEAEIKVDTFSFTKYGLLPGTVLNVSADSIDRSKPSSDTGNKGSSGTADSASEPQGRELVYAAHISLDCTAMAVDGRHVPLMAVTVEIMTGAQRIITYLLSPLFRFKQDSLHER